MCLRVSFLGLGLSQSHYLWFTEHREPLACSRAAPVRTSTASNLFWVHGGREFTGRCFILGVLEVPGSNHPKGYGFSVACWGLLMHWSNGSRVYLALRRVYDNVREIFGCHSGSGESCHWLTFGGWSPGILLNTLQHTEQYPKTRTNQASGLQCQQCQKG